MATSFRADFTLGHAIQAEEFRLDSWSLTCPLPELLENLRVA